MFWLGMACGGLLTLVFVCCLMCQKRTLSVGNKRQHAASPFESGWEETRNFLYYDGTQMPLKEENHE